MVTYAQSIEDPVIGLLNVKVSAGSVKIIKTSEDGKVEGLRFTVTGENFSETAETNSSGELIIHNLIPGMYTVTEETPQAYRPQESRTVVAESGKTAEVSFSNVLKKGKIAVVKHMDDGETGVETPEEGAEFAVFLKSAGSFDAAEERNRDYLICDEYGYAETKALPCGVYTVVQEKGCEGFELCEAFDVSIEEDGRIYRYVLNNAAIRSYIEIIKKDAETGRVIPAAGFGFKVRNTATGEYVVQHVNNPSPMEIDTFYTDASGRLLLPEKLPYGTYELIETESAHGYVLDTSPVPFVVDGTQTTVTVEKYNTAQKGIIAIHKTGEVFSSVAETDGRYQPVYAERGLAGAVYEIYAAEDIVTPDGTVRVKKGELAGTAETGEDGRAVSAPLYLGQYKVIEKQAPYGMTLHTEPVFVTLSYAGQETEITETSVFFRNERQRAELSLQKTLEEDSLFGIGRNGEIRSVQFGLYAAEDMTAADGTVIPKDGLLETVFCDENGYAVFSTDFPAGAKLYVREYSTDEHYVLSDTLYPVVFDYAGQDTATVRIAVHDGEAIINRLIRGGVRGFKTDRENGEQVAGALFGLFRADETTFTEDTALLTSVSDADGVFRFEGVPYGIWIVRELKPAEGFLPGGESFTVQITEQDAVVMLTAVNDRIPEIGTTAAIGGEKEADRAQEIVLTDVVSYRHLVPGKEYTVQGVLMDRSAGKPLLINGEEVRAETTFIPSSPSGEVKVEFVFDGSVLKQDTEIVVFERLYSAGIELAAHADIDDEGQTVLVRVPVTENPKTGDSARPVMFWLGLSLTLAGGLALLFRRRLLK